ncbi:SDR family oxidoreductase [Microvirga pudoricolor]|uniref:SDR family oxidoreductase n=1 Tax=Microvirga pudoricolor TaxID=2778729 RepID=UPI00194F3CAC|nr:SDR family oxidoreductase [Microvirga pudoricolor]MBM6594073.1 SDR family oxidoreductase [Microvirga pudoricolor]
MTLKGQTALVTGGSSGIGAGIAQALGAAGVRVAINYRSGGDAAKTLADEITQAGGEAFAVGADVSDEAAVDAMVAQTVERFGRLDILVANSGLQKDAAFKDMSLDDWRKVIDVNLTGQFLSCRAAVRQFLRQPETPNVSRARGKIICMSSVHEVIPWAGHVNYAASKGGVMLMMKSLAQEVAHEHIRVNAIAPGAIRTPINKEAWGTEEALRRLLKLIPYGRIGEPEDVAKAALWLASDDSDYVTGTTLFVDGGMTLYPGFEDNG